MTEQSLGGEIQGQNNSTNTPNLSTSGVATTTEKMLPQSKVDELIKTNKIDSYERGKREALAEIERQRASSQQGTGQQTSSMGGMQQMSQDEVRQMMHNIASEVVKPVVESTLQQRDTNARQAQQEQQLNTVLTDFVNKISEGAKNYPDFQEVVGQLELPNTIQENPALLFLYSSVDNPADVLYDLAKNPTKVAAIESLYKSGRQNVAKAQLKSLSDSIKANAAGVNAQRPNAPLGQLKTSPLGVDNGKMSIGELKKADWLRA